MARLTLKTGAILLGIIIALMILLSNLQNYNVKRSKFRKIQYSKYSRGGQVSNFDDNDSVEAKVIEVENVKAKQENPDWNRIEQKMIHNMEKADMQDRQKLSPDILEKLPDPKVIVQEAIGPVAKKTKKKKEAKMSMLDRFKLILSSLKCKIPSSSLVKRLVLIIGRPGTGLDEIAGVLHRKHGVFMYQAESSLDEASEVIHGLTNLSNCAVTISDNRLDDSFEQSVLKHNSFLKDICDDGSQCLRSPGLVKQFCGHFPVKGLLSDSLDLNEVKAILMQKKNINVDVIYVSRDPRAVLHSKLEQDSESSLSIAERAGQLCQQLKDDLSVVDHKLPKFNFFMLR